MSLPLHLRRFSTSMSSLFNRELKRQQKKWSLAQKEATLAASCILPDTEAQILERFKDMKALPKSFLLLEDFRATLDLMLKDYNQQVEVEKMPIFEFISQLEEPSAKKKSYEAIASVLNLHWLENPLPVIQICSDYLCDNGVFLGSCFGENSIPELKYCLLKAETELCNGISARFAPSLSTQTVANLLSDGHFKSITVDLDRYRIAYPNLKSILKDLQLLGESNCLMKMYHHIIYELLQFRRKSYISRDVLKRCEDIYSSEFSENGNLIATFSVINFIGWKN